MMGIVEVVAREMRRDFRIPRSLEHVQGMGRYIAPAAV
jgi:hypothetical protein